MAHMTKRHFRSPDDVMKAARSRTAIITLGGRSVVMNTFEPGWRWSKDVKPMVGTDSCMRHHYGYAISGRLRTRMDDGSEEEFGPGDMIDTPPGHDGWVVGNEPFVFLDFGDPCNCG